MSLYPITSFLKPSMNVPTGSLASCAAVGHSTLAVAAGTFVLGGVISGCSGLSGYLVSTFGV